VRYIVHNVERVNMLLWSAYVVENLKEYYFDLRRDVLRKSYGARFPQTLRFSRVDM
jgi:hypothetical protein